MTHQCIPGYHWVNHGSWILISINRIYGTIIHNDYSRCSKHWFPRSCKTFTWKQIHSLQVSQSLVSFQWGISYILEIDETQHGHANSKGAVTCAVCPESAWLVTLLIGNVSTGVVTWSALRCGASGESDKKVAAAPLSKTAATAAAAETWFAKLQLDYMLHNRFPWKRSGRRSSTWPPYSLWRNLSAAACRPCDRSLRCE